MHNLHSLLELLEGFGTLKAPVEKLERTSTPERNPSTFYSVSKNLDPNSKAQNCPKALYSMVFGPISLKTLEPQGNPTLNPKPKP